jgi:flagellar biogenesis protein FliO
MAMQHQRQTRRRVWNALRLLPVVLCTTVTGLAAGQDGPGLGPLDLSPSVPEATADQTPLPEAATPTIEPTVQDPVPGAFGPEPEPASAAEAETTAPALETSSPVVAPAATEAPTSLADEPAATSRWSSRQLPGADTVDEIGGIVPSGEGAGEAAQVGASLAGVIALIWVVRYMIRRSRGDYAGSRILAGARAPSGVTSVLARYPIARGQQVLLLEVGRRIIVVHQGEGALGTLSEITDAEEVADLKARISGVERSETDKSFNAELSSSLEVRPTKETLSAVDGMPGMVAQTVDLTRRGKRSRRLAGGAV